MAGQNVYVEMVPPQNYKCAVCFVWGKRLIRETEVFDMELRCYSCVRRMDDLRRPWYPAVPVDSEGLRYWNIDSIPSEGLDWWHAI